MVKFRFFFFSSFSSFSSSLFPFSHSLDSFLLKRFEISQARIITAAGGRAIAGPGIDVLDLVPTSYHGKRREDEEKLKLLFFFHFFR